ncbi:MAG: ABC transporter ATP-binding protein [Acidimicrobiales bacterium]
MGPLLSVRDLRTWFASDAGDAKAVDGVSFDVMPGEIFGIVGESGSGKSVTALSILGLIPQPPGRIESGEILWKGRDLLHVPDGELRKVRGKEIAMIFQDPMTSLNPVFTIGRQIAEMVRLHEHVGKAEARRRAVDMLGLVGIPNPASRVDDYPHQFSGGMRQRAMIAMAISCEPDLLIADEPTTALDVTVQAQVLEVLQRAAEASSSSIILITHDLGVVAGLADRVAVMYAGQIVEEGTVDALYYGSRMPYAWGLLESIARLDQRRLGRLRPIAGQPPSLLRPPSGCRFHPRCLYRDDDVCVRDMPELVTSTFDQSSRCHFAREPGWFSPAERLVRPRAEWHPRVQAAEARADHLDELAVAVAGDALDAAPPASPPAPGGAEGQ